MKKLTPNYFVYLLIFNEVGLYLTRAKTIKAQINNHNSPSFIAKILGNEDFHPLEILFNFQLIFMQNNIIQGHLASLNHKFKPILKKNIQTISLPLQYSKIRSK
jgi:hypothetical protein